LSEGPPQAPECAGRENDNKPRKDEMSLRRYHKKHARRDEEDDAYQSERESL
jgi:hypothetical protein